MNEKMNDKEILIVKNLFEHEEFSTKVLPFLNPDYFDDLRAKDIIRKFVKYAEEFKSVPNYETMHIVLQDDKGNINASDNVKCLEFLKAEKKQTFDYEFLMKEAEKYFQWSVLSKAVIKSAEILAMPENEEKHKTKSLVPEMIREALKISFENNTGREFLTQKVIEAQYEHYHNAERKYPLCRWKHFTQVLKGGMSRKKLHLFMSGTGTGKTSWMVNIAEQFITIGLDVLYVTLEIAEEEIIERIDANLLDTDTDKLVYISKPDYIQKLTDIKKKNAGRLFVKEYPPASISANDIRILLDELKIRHNFTPTVLIVDYLNLMKSVRYKNAGDSYAYVKGVTEELRGIAVERDLVTISATQTNRGQINSTDPELDGISDSIGVAFTADWICALIETPEMRANNEQKLKQLKSRYAPIYKTNAEWSILINKDKQRITEKDNYDVNEENTNAQLSDKERPNAYKGRKKQGNSNSEESKGYKMPHVEAEEKSKNQNDIENWNFG